MKLNNLSRLTALLLALTMILPTFAVAEDSSTNVSDLTGDKLAQYNAAAAMIADDKCSLCAETLTNRDVLTWPIDNVDCLHTYLASMSANEICQLLYDLDRGTSAEYTLGQVYINAHNSHVDSTDESLHRAAVICYGLSCYKNPLTNPGPDHVDGCPWKQDTPYTPTTSATLTDATTGITVTGNLPAGVKLTVTQVNATVDDVLSMINQEDYAEEPSVLRYDITLTLNDEVWQPTTPVTVKVPGVYETVPANPLAEIIHMTSAVAAGYEKLANVTVNADGSVTFDATGFSTYYVVAGTGTDISGGTNNDTYYILRGTSVELEGVTGGNVTYPEGVTADTSGVAVTLESGNLLFAASQTAAYGTYYISTGSGRTVTIHILSAEDMFNSVNNKSVYISVLSDSTAVPSEPMSGGNYTWNYIEKGTDGSYRFTTNTWSPYVYATSPNGVLNLKEIANSDTLKQNLQGQNVIGVIDSGWGTDTYTCVEFTDEDWHNILVDFVSGNRTVYISDGAGSRTQLKSSMLDEQVELPNGEIGYRYQIYPYVVKLILESSNTQKGWHVDCAIVDRKTYSVAYNYNLPLTAVVDEGAKQLSVPATKFYAPYTTGVSVDKMQLVTNSWSSTPINVGDEISIYDSQLQQTFTYTFVGWNTAPDGSGNSYKPDDLLPEITANVTLYAIWESDQDTGSLRIDKEVVFTDENDTRKDDDVSYTFAITLGGDTGVKYPYTIYAADGNIITNANAENGIQNNDTISLKDGQHAIVFNVPAGSVTVTETATNNATPSWQVGSGSVTEGNSTTVTVTAGYTTNVTCTNVYELDVADLTITKTVIGTTETDTFEFTVELTDANGNPLTGEFGITGANEVETIEHNGKFTLTVEPSVNTSTSVTIADLPIGTKYTVTETPQAGYTANALSESGTISTADGATAEFINTYSVGNLSITKKVVDGTETNGTNSDSFGFTVKLTAPANVVLADNYTVTGVTDAKYDKTEGVITFSLSNNQAAVITGIQVGVGYQVVETVDATKYTTEVDNVANTATSGTIAASGNAHVFTNTYTKGDLTISKTVSGAGGTFTFKVSLLDANKNVVSGSFDITGAEVSTISHGGEFTLTVGNNGVASVTIKDLPAGTVCTVTETPVAGYATTANDQTSLSGSATIQQGTTVTIPFTNTYSVANLTITKKVVPETNVTAPADAFTITVNLTAGANAVLADTYTVKMGNTNLEATYTPAANMKTATLVFDLVDGQTATISGLQVDTAYTVSEADMPYYTEVVNASGATISSEAANKVTVTNMYNTGNLKVAKKVEGTYAPKGEQSETFNFTLTLKDNGSTVTPPITVNNQTVNWSDGVYVFTLKDGDSITIYGIPDGVTYTVTEVQPEGFDYTTKVNDVAGNTATGTANNDPTVTFTNTYKYSKLTITKNVSEDTPAGIADQSFNITVTLPNNTGNYDYTSSNGTSGKVPSDGKLTIKDGEAITIDKVPIGETYSVTEDDLTYFDEKVEPNSGTIVDAGNTVAITNTYKPGKLTISKNVVGTTAPKGQESEEFAFVVTLTDEKGAKVSGTFAYTKGADTASLPFTEGSAEIKLKDGESITFTNLPQGVEYKVEETDDNVSAKYTPTSNGEEGTISETDSNAAFTNTYKFNDLTISKIVVNKSATLYEAPAVEFPFVLVLKDANGNPLTGTYQVKDSDEKIVLGTTFNLKAGESITIQDLPVGATYTVTENAVEGFVLGSKTGDTGSIEANQEYKAIFTNEYHVGQLKISKKVEGADAPKDAEGNYSDVFTFNVSLKDATGTAMTGYTYKIGENGEAKQLTESIELKDGQTAIIDKLPAGTTYVITESHPDYTTKVGETETNTATGTIVADSSSRVEFTNTYKYSHLTIKKTGMKAGESAIFTVTCDGKTYTVVVPNEKEIVIGKLPIGETYTITEIGDWTWLYANTTYQYSNVECKIVEGGSRVDVTNKGTDKWLHDESGVINTYGIPGGNPIN